MASFCPGVLAAEEKSEFVLGTSQGCLGTSWHVLARLGSDMTCLGRGVWTVAGGTVWRLLLVLCVLLVVCVLWGHGMPRKCDVRVRFPVIPIDYRTVVFFYWTLRNYRVSMFAMPRTMTIGPDVGYTLWFTKRRIMRNPADTLCTNWTSAGILDITIHGVAQHQLLLGSTPRCAFG